LKDLHHPLLAALGGFKRTYLPANTLLFHGGRSGSPHADPETLKLAGSRKWFSEDAVYAVSYSYIDSEKYGVPLLWVCRARLDISALHGSQFGLRHSHPCGSAFPEAFPNKFVDYAGALLGGKGPFALLDHKNGERFQEVLVTEPESSIQVVEVVTLPSKKELAEQYAQQRFGFRT
jgi:hypothetical protein